MWQAFMIVFREGFESFLIVAVMLSYLKKTMSRWLEPAVCWGIVLSLLTSGALGYALREGVHQSFWEGILGVFTVIMVGTLVIHMWRVGPRFKSQMESKLLAASSRSSRQLAFWGVLLFTVLMITREGMETVVMLIQVRDSRFTAGVLLGAGAAALLSLAWIRFSHLINVRRFFQVTGIYLLLFLAQVGVYSLHEFSEAGILPQSEAIHVATERFSPVGIYGKWFSALIVIICAVWLLVGWIQDLVRRRNA